MTTINQTERPAAMTVAEIKAALNARIAELPNHEHYEWSVHEDDFRVTLIVDYPEHASINGGLTEEPDEWITDEPWVLFGCDDLLKHGFGGMDNNDRGGCCQFVTFTRDEDEVIL